VTAPPGGALPPKREAAKGGGGGGSRADAFIRVSRRLTGAQTDIPTASTLKEIVPAEPTSRHGENESDGLAQGSGFTCERVAPHLTRIPFLTVPTVFSGRRRRRRG